MKRRSTRAGALRVLARSGFLPAVAIALAASLAHATDPPSVPWPGGTPPDEASLAKMIDDAVVLAQREFGDEAIGAIEPAEEREHMTAQQDVIDNGDYDEDRLFRMGDTFFGRDFSSLDGYGDGPDRRLKRIHDGVRGGRDNHSCAGCHTVGGVDGAGAETQRAFLEGDGDRESSALVRNAPIVIGSGFVQALGVEMTTELARLRDGAIASAKSQGTAVTVQLGSKGVSFGKLVAMPDGSLDTSGVDGLASDLVVRPFGWKGTGARLRRFAEDAARLHFGVQSHVLAEQYQTTPDVPRLGPGPNWFDPDNDGVPRELEEGSLTAIGVYMTLLEAPIILPPSDAGLRERWARGGARFDEVGCANCHTRSLPLYDNNWREMPDTTKGAGVDVELFLDGEHPRSGPNVHLFSDLKRHDMGASLADRHGNAEGVAPSVFLTRPLWGLADSAPYMHDGRAATIPEAILAHDGEARASREAFVALSDEAQRDLHVYLLSLTRSQKVRVIR